MMTLEQAVDALLADDYSAHDPSKFIEELHARILVVKQARDRHEPLLIRANRLVKATDDFLNGRMCDMKSLNSLAIARAAYGPAE